MEHRAAAEQAQRRCSTYPGLAIELKTQHVAQAAETGTLERLGKHGLRIETGDECLRADDMRDAAGGKPDGAVGPEVDAKPRERCQHQDGSHGEDPLPGGHTVLR